MVKNIDLKTQLRTLTKNDFEIDFFKLVNNSVFGKTTQNIGKHNDIKVITNIESFLKTVRKPNFKSSICFSENLMGCEMRKTKVTMNKPVYLGEAILDLSKLVMYEFHYDYMIPKYSGNLKVCFMDTDSLVYHIKTNGLYSDIAEDVKARFSRNGYDASDARALPGGKNKKLVEFMKDELGGKIMTGFVVLRPKLYAYRKLDIKEDKRCKGIEKCMVNKMISFDDYKNCLLSRKSVNRAQLIFGSNQHRINTVRVNKVALNRDDDKQIVKKDWISTLACGHYSLCRNSLLGVISLE